MEHASRHQDHFRMIACRIDEIATDADLTGIEIREA